MSGYNVDDWEQRQLDQGEEDYMNYLMLRQEPYETKYMTDNRQEMFAHST